MPLIAAVALSTFWIVIEAELFSLDGKKRFYEKKNNKIEKAGELGFEVGELLKIKSENTYRK